jgi:hypothetical protein
MSSENIEPVEIFEPPLVEAYTCKQIDLFQFFLCNNEEQRDKMSNAIPLWDCLPRYSMSRQAAHKMRKAGTLPSLLNIACRYLGQGFVVQIQPARIIDDKGQVTEYYPSANEELIEDALRKISTLQNQGFFDQSRPRSGVSFTIYQLREELRKQGHTRSYKEIVLSLQILARSVIEIKTEGKKNRAFDVSAYFRRLSSVSRRDLLEDPDARWFVEFHPLITQAINAIDYRQYNYALMMSHSTQLARWLHKYLAVKFTYAQVGKEFEIRFSTVKRDSALLESYDRNRDAISAMSHALDELKKNGLLLSVKENKIVSSQGKVEEVAYALSPTIKFSAEVTASNKRVDIAKANLPAS